MNWMQKSLIIGWVLMLMACGHSPIEQEPIPEGDGLSLEQTARWAQIDYANRLKADLDAVSVLEARPVIWSNGAIGCPRPDGFYTQALVDGYLIVLTSNRQPSATYHAIRGRAPFLCPEERRERPIDVGESIY